MNESGQLVAIGVAEKVEREEPVDAVFVDVTAVPACDLESPHTDEGPAATFRGDASAVDVEVITPQWVLQRLHKEATDFGTRTRQSSRVKALELLGKHLAMFTEVVEVKDPVREALKDLDPWERKKRILEIASRMIEDPGFTASVAKAAQEKT